MALPGFYNEADQAIYASGDKFIPQEQYRLGYTHPPSATQEAGITNTQVNFCHDNFIAYILIPLPQVLLILLQQELLTHKQLDLTWAILVMKHGY